jgi:hypothetical protein
VALRREGALARTGLARGRGACGSGRTPLLALGQRCPESLKPTRSRASQVKAHAIYFAWSFSFSTRMCSMLHISQQPREQGGPGSTGPLKEMHPIAPQRRPNSPCFMHLFRLVLTRSRCPQLPKANHFLAYLAVLAGPEALSRPSTEQKSLGRGRFPPLRPHLRRCAAPPASA